MLGKKGAAASVENSAMIVHQMQMQTRSLPVISKGRMKSLRCGMITAINHTIPRKTAGRSMGSLQIEEQQAKWQTN